VRPPALSRATVDRDAATRESDEALEQAWRDARVLVVDDQARALLDGTELLFLSSDEAPDGDRLYLGTERGQAYFAVSGDLPRRLGAQPRSLRDVGALLSDRDAGLLVHAVGLANWHATHPRCPRCGAPTTSTRGGAVRVCPDDGSEHFPRTDPAMIVLVTDGQDRCVLGRQAIGPAGRYSTLAGFVEPGESAEQAVVREVREETGIAVTDVVYKASQPWPFPASLMLGFYALCAPDTEPVASDGELEDARWFTKDELRDGTAMLPTPVSIAHKLITDWLEE
jgi:NAD+ diphosphatase